MKQVYPVWILDTKEETEHPFLVCVPDLDVLTQGENLADAIQMARDAIGVTGISMEDHKETIPEPSGLEQAMAKINQDANLLDFAQGIVTYVDVDFLEYRRKYDNRTVRRNVALPSWLNYEAEKAGLNVSRVLQEALMRVLNLEPRR